jgi:hypothetical protein
VFYLLINQKTKDFPHLQSAAINNQFAAVVAVPTKLANFNTWILQFYIHVAGYSGNQLMHHSVSK